MRVPLASTHQSSEPRATPRGWVPVRRDFIRLVEDQRPTLVVDEDEGLRNAKGERAELESAQTSARARNPSRWELKLIGKVCGTLEV